MTVQIPFEDPLDAEISQVLQALAAGATGADVETQRVDLKEEAGRRDREGKLLQPVAQSEIAAQQLAKESACMANSNAAGALILGMADNGVLIGTGLDAEWLRHRIYQILENRLTVDVRELSIDGCRLLVLRIPRAVEPIRYKGKFHWRVGASCVEIDASAWHDMQRKLHFDWSAESSHRPLSDARASALEQAREYLRESGEQNSIDLSDATDTDLLRRIGAVHPDGMLTNGGACMFAAKKEAAIDYIRRAQRGGDSVIRLRPEGVSLIEELRAVEQGFIASNPVIHRSSQGLAIGQIEALPRRAVREAMVNGVAHRDWHSPEPTTIEHIGNTLTVTSPGGFPPGISPANIITHPSTPVNKALTAMLAKLRIAEREGIGVDRMVADMIRYGYAPPVIEEVTGPYVRVVLLGGAPDEEWLTLLSRITPISQAQDLDSLLLLSAAIDVGWIDAQAGMRPLQKSLKETEHAIDLLATAVAQGEPVILRVDGVPTEAPPAWRPSDEVRTLTSTRTARVVKASSRPQVAMSWARSRGRISSTELADISATQINHAGKILKDLRDDGLLAGSSESGGGRGFHYRLVLNAAAT